MGNEQQDAMHGNVGMQPEMQAGLLGFLGTASNVPHMQEGQHAQVNPTVGSGNRPLDTPQRQQLPLLQLPVYDQLERMGKLKEYKEGGAVVKFETFNGH